MSCCSFLDTGALNPHLLSPLYPLLRSRTPYLLHILIHTIAQHLLMRESPHFFALFSPTQLTSLVHRSQVLSRSNFLTFSFELWWEWHNMAAHVMRSSSRALIWYLGRWGSAGWCERHVAKYVICLCLVRVASMCRTNAYMCIVLVLPHID